jgi:hypothetical protein
MCNTPSRNGPSCRSELVSIQAGDAVTSSLPIVLPAACPGWSPPIRRISIQAREQINIAAKTLSGIREYQPWRTVLGLHCFSHRICPFCDMKP